MKIKIGMVMLGCAKNRVDAEIMMAKLREAGYELVSEAGMSDVAIVNTCGFIGEAKQEAIEEILELGLLKKEGRIKAIIVTGCLSERYQQEVADELPEVDAVLGIGANKDIVKVVEDVLTEKRVVSFPPKNELPLDGDRVQSTPYFYTYIKIAEGCQNNCTYCAIPMIRGEFRSRPMENIVEEARHFAENGVREIVVIAQDTTRYGEDLYGEKKLPELLKQLCAIEKLSWIRVMYCYPERITDELIDVIASEEKIVKYLDIPIQHCNEQVLKRMNRKGSREKLTELFAKLKARIPNIILRTTVMVGFPGETEEQFEELAKFVEETKFDRLGCFAYSPEEGTPAANFSDQIDDQIKEMRRENIIDMQERIMEEKAASLEGKKVAVMVEGFDRYAESYFGRSYADAPEVDGKVFFANDKKVKLYSGEFVEVEISDHLGCDLLGDLTNKIGTKQ